jgi:hypothetical protein
MRRLLVVHHSHTDVGYAELQGRVARRHADDVTWGADLGDPARARAEAEAVSHGSLVVRLGGEA